MDNQQERLAFDKGWIIGIIDGEGSILLTKKKIGYYPSIQIGNCRVEVVNRLREILDSLKVPYYVCPETKTKANKIFQRIDIGGFQRMIRFFEVFPLSLFTCKFEEAMILHQYLEYRRGLEPNSNFGSFEHSIYLRLKGFGNR